MTDVKDQSNPGQRLADERRLWRMLATALGLLLAAMLANFGYSLWTDRKDRLRDAEKTTVNLVRTIEEQTANMVNAAEFSLSSAERRINRIPEAERSTGPAAQEVLLDNQRAMPFARAVFFLDALGRVLYDSQRFPAVPTDYADRDFFRVHRDATAAGSFIGAPAPGAGPAENFISVSRRLEGPDGTFAGVAVVAIDPQYLMRFYKTVDVGATGAIGLFLRDGALLARSPAADANALAGLANSELFRRYLPQARSGSFVTTSSLDGIERIVSYRQLPTRPLVVTTGLGTQEVMEGWASRAWAYATVALLLLALVVRLGDLVFRELLRREQLTDVLRKSEQDLSAMLVELRISAIAFQTHEMIAITDAERRIVRANDAFSRETGYAPGELIGRSASMLQARSPEHDKVFYAQRRETLERKGTWQGEVLCRRKDGSQFPARMTVTAVVDPAQQVTHHVSVLSDITRDKENEQRIHRLAFYDPLTNLPNRSLLRDRLRQALVRAARDRSHGALLFLDLDNFKTLNDTRGHGVGDMLLVEVANRLRHGVRASDTVARLGGDEFIVLLGDLSPDPLQAPMEARDLARKLLDSLNRAFVLADLSHHNSASIGIAVFCDAPVDVDELLRQADLAMYQAKSAGRNAMRFFDVGMQHALQDRVALEAELREALQRQELQLHYQPVVRNDGLVTGAEALARWPHAVRGMVPPSQFIALAEAAGLIVPLGQWVLHTACRQLAAWGAHAASARLSLSVNVSAHQLRENDFVDKVFAAVEATGADPTRLVLELTESALAHDVDDVVAKMQALRDKGIRFSLDDFGTGYSSLSYLRRLPLGQVKIDQSFVRDVLDDPNDAAIARTIVLLGQSLGLDVVAEGVETDGQRQFLLDSGCTNYQGYLFSKPLAIADFDAFVMQPAI